MNLRAWARALRHDGVALWFATRHPGVPWIAKALAWGVVAYALSPIDLIPDVIPVLGLLDDVLLLPGLIWLALRCIPAPVLAECRARAADWLARREARPRSLAGAGLVVLVWLAAAAATWHWVLRPGWG